MQDRLRERRRRARQEFRAAAELDGGTRTTMQQPEEMQRSVHRMYAWKGEPVVPRDLPGNRAKFVASHQRFFGVFRGQASFPVIFSAVPVKTTLPLVTLVAALTVAPEAGAQWARGAGPDAGAIPAGSVRVGASATWTRSIEAWFDDVLKPLGSPFTVDSLGASRVQSLTGPQIFIQNASGLTNFRATLGASAAQVRRSIETTPFTLEYGVTSRLTVGALLPLVTSIARVDAVMNSATANVGINPALTIPAVATANGALVSQIEGANSFVSGRIATCNANPAATGCSGFNAAAAQALVTEATAYSAALASLFGGKNGSLGQPFVPTSGSAAQTAIATRLADLKTRFSALGANQVTSDAPKGGAPITTADLQSILTDAAFGVGARPLGSVVKRGMGDIELSGQFVWHDSHAASPASGSWRERLWWRSAVIATQRLGTGAGSEPEDLVPVPLGTGLSATSVRLVTDIGIGTRWSVTTMQGYSTRASGGDDEEIAFTLAPRLAPTEAISIAGVYDFRSIAGERIELGPEPYRPFDLREPVTGTEHRLGASLSYSSLAAFQRKAARLPLEITITHFQSMSGAGFFIPKLSHDAVAVRWYWRARRAAR
jgi:hypothetical protein